MSDPTYIMASVHVVNYQLYSNTSISHTLRTSSPGSPQTHKRISEQLCAAHTHSKWEVLIIESVSCLPLKRHIVGTPQNGLQEDPVSGPTWLINSEETLAHVSPWKRRERKLVWTATWRVLYITRSEPTRRTREFMKVKQVALLWSDIALISPCPGSYCWIAGLQVIPICKAVV